MNFLKNIFSSKKQKFEPPNLTNDSVQTSSSKTNQEDDFVRLGIAYPVDEEEKELLSIITSAILSGDSANSNIKIKNVYAIDDEKETAAIIASAVAAENNPSSNYKLMSVEEA